MGVLVRIFAPKRDHCDRIKEYEMGGDYSTNGIRNACTNFVVQVEWKRPLG